MKIVYPAGATPLDPNELDGLIPTLQTQQELNEVEKANIKIGLEWAERSRFLKKNLLTYSGLFRLHRELFGQVWRWAGEKRQSEKNIGIAPHQIPQEVHTLCLDVQFWVDNKTYLWEEVGARFHHRLVYIHPFVNGNGRFARIAADLLLSYYRQPFFTWGAKELIAEGEARQAYIRALKAADRGDYALLIKFVKT